jgi:hypothetical protein
MMQKSSSRLKDQSKKSVYKILNEHLNPEKDAQAFIKLNGIEAITATAKFLTRSIESIINAWAQINSREKIFLLGSIITFLFAFALGAVRRFFMVPVSNIPAQGSTLMQYKLLFLLLFIVFTWSFFISLAIGQTKNETATIESTFNKIESDQEGDKECVRELSNFSKYELKSAKEQIGLHIKSIQLREKTSSSLLPLFAIALVVLAIDLLNIPIRFLTNNLLHGTVTGASGFVAIVLPGLKLWIDSNLQTRLVLFERCLVILERALATKD